MINDKDLQDYEDTGCEGDSYLHQIVCKLVLELRRLKHELEDPNYLYAGSRICRQGIISRNATIDSLRDEIRKLREGAK